MLTLDLSNPFTFTLKDQFGVEKEVSGTFREMTKKEQSDFKDKNEKLNKVVRQGEKLINKINRNKQLMILLEKSEQFKEASTLFVETADLEDQLNTLSDSFDPAKERNMILKARFETCLGGSDIGAIMEVGEVYGYDRVLDVILKSIAEDKEGK